MTIFRRMTRPLAITLVLLACWSVNGRIVYAQPPSSPAQEGFVPVDQLPPEDRMPAAPLLISAYVVAWVAVFGYLWSVWQRMGRVERELAAIRARVEERAHPRRN